MNWYVLIYFLFFQFNGDQAYYIGTNYQAIDTKVFDKSLSAFFNSDYSYYDIGSY